MALPNSGKLGPIIDISLCGVSCEFIVNFSEGEVSTVEAAPALPADILVSNKSLYPRNILCRVFSPIIQPLFRSLPYENKE